MVQVVVRPPKAHILDETVRLEKGEKLFEAHFAGIPDVDLERFCPQNQILDVLRFVLVRLRRVAQRNVIFGNICNRNET